jgi:hypothetical protein
MSNIPDFSFKGQIDPTSLLQAYNQKAQLELQAEQNKRAKVKQVADIFNQGASLVNNLVQHSQAQQMKTAQGAVAEWLKMGSQPEMSPMQGYVDAMGQKGIPAQAMQEGAGGMMEPMQAPTGRQMSETDDYKAQLASLVTKAFPEDAGKQLSKQAFAQLAPQESKPSEMSPLKPMVINGEPKMVREDKQTGNLVLRDGTPVPVDAELEPYNAGFYQNVRLTDRDRQDTSLQQQARLVLEGKLLPGGAAALRTPRGQKIAALATEMDPDFDFQTYDVRKNLRKEFTSGRRGQEAKALDTMILHADKLMDAADSMNKSNIRKYNTVKNWIEREGKGNPELIKTAMLARGTARETLRILQGVGVITQQEAEEMKNDLDVNAAPKEFLGAVDAMFELAGGRLITLQSDWKHTMGDTPTPVPIMNERSINILNRRGYDPETMERLQSPTAQGGDLGAALRQLLPKRK